MTENCGKKYSSCDFLIVVVVYNKSIDSLKYIEEIHGLSILIFDNSEEAQKAFANTIYYHSPKNVGVSAAYNYSFDYAQQNNKKFLIILDQDTIFCKDYLVKYINYANTYGDDFIYAPIVHSQTQVYSPYKEKYWRNACQHINKIDYGLKWNLKSESYINSGLMIPVKVNSIVGGFNNSIKLDFSDTYYMDKYKKNYDRIMIMNIKLDHKLSGDEGKNYTKELHRFKYFCNGAKIYEKIAFNSSRVRRIVVFRLFRLIAKYRRLSFFNIYYHYYIGDKKI